MKPDYDPKSILVGLENGETLPFDAPAIQTARDLAGSLDPRRAKEVEGLPEPLTLALLEAAVRSENVSFAEAVATSSSKSVTKAAKKAIYRLRSRGVAVPEARPAPSASATPQVESPEPLPGVLSPLTGDGERAVVLARTVRGRFETAHLVLSDEHGVTQFELLESSRSGYRAVLRDLKNKKIPGVAVTMDEARNQVARAVARNIETNTPFPQGLDDVLRRFGISPTSASIIIPPPLPEDAALASNGGKLHEEPEIRAWLPPMEQLRLFVLKMDEIAQSKLYINEAQRAEQARHLVHSMARYFLTPEISKLYARRLWEMADYFDRTDRAMPATWARAEARLLCHAAEDRLSPFAEQFFDKVVELSRQASAGEELPEPSAQTGSAPPERERRSPGGLILP